jgi:hypothetical protein
MPPKARPIADRLWEKVDFNGPVPENRPELGPCWIWTASKNNWGYGQISNWPYAPLLAHRLIWFLTRGDITEGLEPDHLCRNRACVNPDHLELVTRQVNLSRGMGTSHRLARENRCIRGHEFTPENTYTYPSGSVNAGKKTCVACRKVRYRDGEIRTHVFLRPKQAD